MLMKTIETFPIKLIALNTFIMRFSLLRVVLITLILIGFNVAASLGTKSYYSELNMPPSFRHVDNFVRHQSVEDYIAAQQIDENTVLILGDCISYGFFVAHSYTHFLDVAGKNFINVSMPTFDFDQMIDTIRIGKEHGIENVVVQLHPVGGYAHSRKSWERRSLRSPADVNIGRKIEDFDFAAQAIKNRDRSIQIRMIKPENIGQIGTSQFWSKVSTKIRYELLPKMPLFGNRFAVDDWTGLHFSTFSKYTKRVDIALTPLPDDEHIKIIKDKPKTWERLHILDEEQFQKEMVLTSAPIRLAKVLRENEMQAVFLMAPTKVSLIANNTVATKRDFNFTNQVLKNGIEQLGFQYLDYMNDPDLVKHMYYYDNLTALGHVEFAKKVSADLRNVLQTR